MCSIIYKSAMQHIPQISSCYTAREDAVFVEPWIDNNYINSTFAEMHLFSRRLMSLQS